MKVAGLDIDLTLVTAEASDYHLSCFDKMLEKVLEIKTNIREEFEYTGKTDLGLMMEVARKYGKLDEFMRKKPEAKKYLKYFFEKDFDKCKIRLMPGAKRLLDYLSSETDTIITPMTGNSESIAKAKIRRLGVEKYFIYEIGGYGDDFDKRTDIVRDMVKKSGEFSKKNFGGLVDVYVFDDTPRGIKAALEGDAKGIAVMTGHYKEPSEFEKYRPIAILNNLGEMNIVKKIFPPK